MKSGVPPLPARPSTLSVNPAPATDRLGAGDHRKTKESRRSTAPAHVLDYYETRGERDERLVGGRRDVPNSMAKMIKIGRPGVPERAIPRTPKQGQPRLFPPAQQSIPRG